MITRSSLLLVTFLQVALLQMASAADEKSDKCGLASVYSSVSEETASSDGTLAEDFAAAHRMLPFGTRVRIAHQRERALGGDADRRPRPYHRRKNNRYLAGCRVRTRHFGFGAGVHQHRLDARKSSRTEKLIVEANTPANSRLDPSISDAKRRSSR